MDMVEAPGTSRRKGYRGLAMEGIVARWYAGLRSTPSQIATWRRQAAQVTAGLPDGAAILEVAPGPGHFAVELARLGRYRVTALDISQTFVDIARENAGKAGVAVEFRQGDASAMPFADGSFDLVVCQAAFKNFTRPGRAIDEMHRVLREGGTALIQDMRRDASAADIDDEVRDMKLGRVSAFMTRSILRRLRRRAYTAERFRELAAASAFGAAEIECTGVGVEVRMRR